MTANTYNLPLSYAFSVCRIEPENNIHIILEAFASFDKFPVIIVGNWNANKYGRSLRKRFQNSQHIIMMDPIYEQEKLNFYRKNCKIYLHGHSCGGTNPSLVEAMYLQLPIIAFDVNFNRETTENQALYFHAAKDLREQCTDVSESELSRIASKMKEIANRRYTWNRISACYAALF